MIADCGLGIADCLKTRVVTRRMSHAADRLKGAIRHQPSAICLFALLLLAGCRQDMHDQPKYKPLKSSPFFDDGRASRPLVPDTVARGHLDDDDALHTGKSGADFVATFPLPITREVLDRGQERYDIYCSPCHDRLGNGEGMIVRRGYRRPPSLHIDRLRATAPGYVFDVISRGFGAMPDYTSQIPVTDRWAIVAYIRALQLSQHAALSDVPPAERATLAQSHD